MIDRRVTTRHWVVDDSTTNSMMLCLINDARRARGLDILHSHPSLVQSATAHSKEMAARCRLDHFSANGQTWADRMAAAGFPGASLMTTNEDIGAGQTSPEQLMSDYAQSPGHWAAIMNSSAQYCGSASAMGIDGWIYWTTDFGWGVTYK